VTAVYLETSALLAWLLGEPAGEGVRETIEAASAIVTSVVTSIETDRVLARALEGRMLREADVRRARGTLARARASWIVMALTDGVATRAGSAFPVEPVRTLDAIHLATALCFTEVFPELRVLTLDRRVSENAVALGLGV